MLPKQSVRLLFGSLLAANAGSLAPAADPNKIALFKNAIVPNEELSIDDFELADFDGSTPIAGATGAQAVAVDPVTGQQRITIKDPAGGYRWVTSGVTNLPQTIYGHVLLVNDLSEWIAMEVWDEPVTLNATGQEVSVPSAKIDIVLNPAS